MRSISLSSPSVYDTSASSGSSTKYHASYEYMTPKMRKRTAPPRVTARRAKKSVSWTSRRGSRAGRGRTVLERDALRDPPTAEDGTTRANRVPKRRAERDDPDVLREREDRSRVSLAVAARRRSEEEKRGTHMRCPEGDSRDLAAVAPLGEEREDEGLDEDGAEQELGEVLDAVPHARDGALLGLGQACSVRGPSPAAAGPRRPRSSPRTLVGLPPCRRARARPGGPSPPPRPPRPPSGPRAAPPGASRALPRRPPSRGPR